MDFLKWEEPWKGDIITNPPYKLADQFVSHSMELVEQGNRVAMFLKLQFLEGKKRREMYRKYPPKYVYVSTGRLRCAINGDFGNATGNAVCYSWFIWEKGFAGEPTIRWFNDNANNEQLRMDIPL